jgi:uncharacterized protein (TIGR00730 family)
MKSLCVYCGASSGNQPVFVQTAVQVGQILAQRGITLIYGGGRVGMMGALADAAMQAGGKVIGVIPQRLMEREAAHRGLTELHVVADMHSRKAMMARLADGFVALPGGIGTLEELFETFTWLQLGFHRMPVGLLDVDGYYAPLQAMLDMAVAQGFVSPQNRAQLLQGVDFEELLDRMQAFAPVDADAWLATKLSEEAARNF